MLIAWIAVIVLFLGGLGFLFFCASGFGGVSSLFSDFTLRVRHDQYAFPEED